MIAIYKLIIVEDEKIIREGLRENIRWDRAGFIVAGVAADGQKALELIGAAKPDVVLSDIRMPGMDGIELLYRLRGIDAGIKAVVLSGYEDFEYARKCIEYGVSAYLLKPVDNAEIEAKFCAIKKELDENYHKNTEYNALKEMMVKSLPAAREKFIRELLEEGEINYDRWDPSVILGMDDPGHYCFGTFLIQTDELCVPEKARALYDLNRIKPVLLRELSEPEPFRPFEALGFANHRIAVFFSLHQNEKTIGMKDTAARVKENLENFLSHGRSDADGGREITVSIGIGTPVRGIAGIRESYIAARAALEKKFFMGKGKILHWDDRTPAGSGMIPGQTSCPESDFVKKIIVSIINGDMDSIDRTVTLYFGAIANSVRFNTANLLMKITEIIMGISMKLAEYDVSMGDVYKGDVVSSVSHFIENGTLADLKDWMIRLCSELALQTSGTARDDKTGQILVAAKKYIEENYHKKITRKEICELTFTSESYFYNLFKQNTGCSLLEYIARIRIEKAKELLARSDMKVYEVAIAVGYEDYRYFSKVFKKLVHVKPAEYRGHLCRSKSARKKR